MKKMFYKKIKILLLLLISFLVLAPIGYCDETEEAALMANLQYAKNEKQEKKGELEAFTVLYERKRLRKCNHYR